MCRSKSIGDWSSPQSEPALQRFLGGVRRIVGTLPQQAPVPDQAPATAQDTVASLAEEFHFEAAPDGSFVFDYVTECGDSFASSYAMAYVIATQPVKIGRSQLVPPGRMLVLGANNPHPRQSLGQYEQNLITPYARAYGAQAKTHRALFGVPGYHRSAAAIHHFGELFCGARSRAARGVGLSFGGWDTHQHHNFFAVPLPHKWWIWGADIRYGQPLESDQFNYFSLVSEQMTSDDRIIICGPQENWLSCDFDDWTEQANFQKILAIAESSGARVVALITGGRREYAHSTVQDKSVEVFEIGGGRSFVYPSHLEPRRAFLRWDASTVGNMPNAEAALPNSHFTSLQRDRGRYEEEHHFWYLNKRGTSSVTEDVRLGIAKIIYAADNPPPAVEIPAPRPALRQPSVAKITSLFPTRSRSAAIVFRSLGFPLSNAYYAMGWGLIYWFITWQFQNLVSQYGISSGKIDGLGLMTSLGDVLPFMPLYLVQAMIADLSLVVMLCLLYAGLVGYVATTSNWPSYLRFPGKLLLGTVHFLSHVAAMFTLSLLVVMLNNWMAPPIERQIDGLYRSRNEQAPIVRDVIEKSLQPLARQNENRQRERAAAPAPTISRQSPVREIVGFTTYPALMVALGSIASGLIWGFYLATTGLVGRGFAERAFGILRLKGYRSFLRMRVDPDRLTIYPVGLSRFPSPKSWTKSREYDPATELLPAHPLAAELLERPIVIKADRSKTGS